MDARKLLIPAVILGALLLVVAGIYLTTPADSLPSLFPGHVSGEADHLHTKHGLAALILGLGCFVFAWFQTGPKTHAA